MNKHIETLIQLSKENPKLEIITMTFWEVVGEDWGYWKGEINEVRKDIWAEIDERIYIGETEIKEKLKEDMDNNLAFDNFSEEQYKDTINDTFNIMLKSGEIKEAIFIFIEV